jgi:hypothetical protein
VHFQNGSWTQTPYHTIKPVAVRAKPSIRPQNGSIIRSASRIVIVKSSAVGYIEFWGDIMSVANRILRQALSHHGGGVIALWKEVSRKSTFPYLIACPQNDTITRNDVVE